MTQTTVNPDVIRNFARQFPRIATRSEAAWQDETLRLLHEARFDATSVVRQPLNRQLTHENGEPKAETLLINEASGLAVYADENPQLDATMWLNCLWPHLLRQGSLIDLEFLRRRVQARHPPAPIVFSAYGDHIIFLEPKNVLTPYPTDDDEIGVIFHGGCGGQLTSIPISKKYYRYRCSNHCSDMPCVPRTKIKIGELRTYFEARFPQSDAESESD